MATKCVVLLFLICYATFSVQSASTHKEYSDLISFIFLSTVNSNQTIPDTQEKLQVKIEIYVAQINMEFIKEEDISDSEPCRVKEEETEELLGWCPLLLCQ